MLSVASFRQRAFILIALSILLLSSTPWIRVQAAAGDLDPTFGAGGKVVTDFAGLLDTAQSVAVQSDGKIIAAGYAQTSPSNSDLNFALARYNIDGSLVPAFGSGGKVTTDFFGDADFAYAVAIQTDGKIVAVGNAFDANGAKMLVRFGEKYERKRSIAGSVSETVRRRCPSLPLSSQVQHPRPPTCRLP